MTKKVNTTHKNLMETFGFASYREFKKHVKEAKEPFPIRMSWKCIATGRRKSGRACIFQQQINESSAVDTSYVSEGNTWIRFNDDLTIWKYLNPLEMQEAIREFDNEGITEIEEDDVFALEALGNNTARSSEYQKKRREEIAAGVRTVKPRGPNVNARRTVVHHFRPY